MQKEHKLKELSQLRLKLRNLMQELKETLEVAFERSILIKGNVYEMSRKCGKANCSCTRGLMHRSMVLSWSEGGRTRLFSLPPEQVHEVTQKSREYLRFRGARARVSVIAKEIIGILDRIEELRREYAHERRSR